MKMRVLLFLFVLFFTACTPFMYGYTWRDTNKQYHLVTGNAKNFGDKRIKYVRGFHCCSALADFLDSKGKPDLIYEYMSDDKRRGIELYYMTIDSVYVFEETGKNKPRSVFKHSRKITEVDKGVYQKLLEGRKVKDGGR